MERAKGSKSGQASGKQQPESGGAARKKEQRETHEEVERQDVGETGSQGEAAGGHESSGGEYSDEDEESSEGEEPSEPDSAEAERIRETRLISALMCQAGLGFVAPCTGQEESAVTQLRLASTYDDQILYLPIEMAHNFSVIYTVENLSQPGRTISVQTRKPILERIINWYKNRDVVATWRNPREGFGLTTYDWETLFPNKDYKLFIDMHDTAKSLGATAFYGVLMEMGMIIMAGKTEEEGRIVFGSEDISCVMKYMVDRRKISKKDEREERRLKRFQDLAEGKIKPKKKSPKSKKHGKRRTRRR